METKGTCRSNRMVTWRGEWDSAGSIVVSGITSWFGCNNQLLLRSQMSLVSGPGHGGGSSQLPSELQLAVEAHVKYIQSLDTVRFSVKVKSPPHGGY
jgi:hypothetical protein